MILEKDNTELILNELNDIADFDENESNSPIIKGRRAFAKTITFRKLRQNHLTEEEIKFMLEHFTFQGVEVSNLIAESIRDLTLDKFLKIGGVEYVYARGQERYRENRDLVDALLSKVRLEDKTEDLSKLLTYIQGKDKFKKYQKETKEIVTFFIEQLYIDGYDIHLTTYKRKLEEIEAIRSNYAVLYDILNNKDNYESDAIVCTGYNITMSVRRDIGFGDIIDVFGDEIGGEMTTLLLGMREMPFSDFAFGVKFITENVELPELAKLITLYTILVSENLDPLLDMNKALAYTEHYYERIETDTPLNLVLRVAIDGRLDFLDNFAERILNSDFVSLDRSREIYKNYFEKVNVTRRYDVNAFQLKVMIGLRLTDNEIAEAIQIMIRNGEGMYMITEAFKCDPCFNWSYPGEKTLKKILHYTIKDLERRYGFSNTSNLTDENVIEEFYNNHLNSFSGRVLLTWKMANDPKFIKKIIINLNDDSYKQRLVTEQINFKAIGFTKYMQILEDAQRNKRESLLYNHSSFNYGFKTSYFSAVSSKALEVATKEEIIMYKHKINESTLLQSQYTPFEVVEFYLDMMERKSLPDHQVDDLKSFIVQGLSVNETFTTEEQVTIMARIGTKRYINRFQRMKMVNSKVNTYKLDIFIPNKETITVEDFHNYYSKVRDK